MLTKKGGNGVKVAKVIQEVNEIINSDTLTYPEKCKKLSSFETSGRPGKHEADDIIYKFQEKYRKYLQNTLKQRMRVESQKYTDVKKFGKFDSVEGYKSFAWYQRFYKQCRNYVVSEVARKLNITGGTYLDYMKHRKEIYFEVKRLQKQEEIKQEERMLFIKTSGLHFSYMSNKKSILEVQENKAGYKSKNIYCMANGYYITVDQNETEDWEAYSKGWHKAHGPKRTIEDRFVQFSKEGESKIVNVSSFAGNYLIKAIIEFFKLKKVKVSKELKKVQLINEAEVTQIRKIRNVTIYERTLTRVHLDYCATYQSETYHAPSIQKAVNGIISKVKSHISEEYELINKNVGFKLGFCESGMQSFCEDNSLDFEGEYTRKDLRNIVTRNRGVNCDKYKSELAKLSIVLNCKKVA